ncbi:MAG: HlyD family secretion protein [Betaproteobacteria bacterium]|nr:HlyD family secretion protein [Betaproteobacteria bacterium]
MTDEIFKAPWLERHRRNLLIGGPVLILLVAGFLYLNSVRYVSTDNAYVGAARTEISANVAGRVVEIGVKDNQAVRQGDLLFRLDDRDFVIAVADAKARLASTKLQISALKATYRQHQADVAAAQETLAYEEHEFERQTRLATQGIASQAQLDQAQHNRAQARQKVRAVQQEQDNVLAALDHHPDQDIDAHPAVQQARAALDRVTLSLSYTIVRAAQDGIVSKVEQLQVGDYINAAVPVFALVSNRNVWIEANFKETELTRMQPGQKSTIEVDTYPGKTFHGHVQSMSPGTGSSFSLLPPENATGNWVKVVQRLPVRISIDDPDPRLPLRAGLSAAVEVDVRHDRDQP